MSQPPNDPPYYGSSPPPYGTPQYPPPPYGTPQYAGYGPPPGPGPELVAPMGLRLLARIIDGLLLFGVALAIMVPLGIGAFHGAHTVTNPDGSQTTTVNNGFFGAFIVTFLIYALISILYEVGMIATRGRTFGKQWVGVRVVRADNAGIPGWGPAFVRWLIPTAAAFLCGLLPLLVYLSPFFDGTHRNQGWHDKASKTFVIRS